MPLALHKLDHDEVPNHRHRPLEARKRDIVFRVKQAVNLGTARLDQRGHLVFRYFLFLHGFGELPRDDLLEKVINAGTPFHQRKRKHRRKLTFQHFISFASFFLENILYNHK